MRLPTQSMKSLSKNLTPSRGCETAQFLKL
nr:MAG TPA: hypothetical protein [Caudoviricetes sp.]